MFFVSFAFSQTPDGYVKKKDDKTGKLIYEGNFKGGKPQGVFKYYYDFDTVKAILDFKQNGKYCYAKLFHPTGKISAQGKYIGESVKDSVWSFFDDGGKLISRDTYSDGKKNGTCYVYLRDGKLAEERNFKMDVLHGTFKQYFDGKAVKSEGAYVNGNLDGKNSHYFPNGVQVATGFYKNGMKTGPWIYRDKDNKVTEKELYINGQLADKKKTEEFFSKNKEAAPSPKEKASTGGKDQTPKGQVKGAKKN
jgi:uncharacterized protein